MIQCVYQCGARAPKKPLQRSGVDNVLGRGRGRPAPKQVWRARVLKRGRPAAEWGCYAALRCATGESLKFGDPAHRSATHAHS
jgi:hypothetical protein